MSRVLVTGGAGFIGSHTCKALAAAGYVPVTYDTLENGIRQAVKWGPLEVGDICDSDRLAQVIETHRPEAVIHFAAYVQVAESIADPGKYYTNNVAGTIRLLDAMRDGGVPSIVFSSSANVYGIPKSMPVAENHPLAPASPYGQTKQMTETIIADYGHAFGMQWAAMRYFNAAGADPDGELGPNHEPITHLIPLVIRAGIGTGPRLDIFGTDYDTPDGTAIRDFIHVSDLASAHIAALKFLQNGGEPGPFNLGTGEGHSVRGVIDATSNFIDGPVPAKACPRRPGDIPVMVADPSKAMALLDWKPEHSSLAEIIATATAWERNRDAKGSHIAAEDGRSAATLDTTR